MHIAGIIAEYNPFHNGHLYQITETKKLTNCDFLIVVMSGHFTQRGEAAICNKFKRAEMALLNGADLVLELPVPFATASAEFFAHYAVSILEQTHLVDTLSFGSELGDLKPLKKIAKLLTDSSSPLDKLIKDQLKLGLSYPKAREKAIELCLKDDLTSIEFLQSPNNILGIEYLKALEKLGSSITPITIKRQGSGYHDTDTNHTFASATAIRRLVAHGQMDYAEYIPENTKPLLAQHTPPNMNALTNFLHYKLMFSQIEDLYALWDIPKALLHTLKNTCTFDLSYTELENLVTSKTYTRATIHRSLLRMLLDIRQNALAPILESQHVPYLRILGGKQSAAPVLKKMIKGSDVPVITNFAKGYMAASSQSKILLDYELTASKLYHYLSPKDNPINQDFTSPFLWI